jgi:hypothetical protein
LLEGVPRETTESLGKGLSVAVFTARTYLDAAADRIPGGVSPLNRAAITDILLLV